jgi:hypothetical protein
MGLGLVTHSEGHARRTVRSPKILFYSPQAEFSAISCLRRFRAACTASIRCCNLLIASGAFQQLTDLRIEFGQTVEAAVAQTAEQPSLDDQHRDFDFCLVTRPARPSRQDRGVVNDRSLKNAINLRTPRSSWTTLFSSSGADGRSRYSSDSSTIFCWRSGSYMHSPRRKTAPAVFSFKSADLNPSE